MISLRKFNTATKFLFLLAPILLVSGCSTVSHSPTATSKAAALAKAECMEAAVEKHSPRETAMERLTRHLGAFATSFMRMVMLAVMLTPILLAAILTVDIPVHAFDWIAGDAVASRPANWLSRGGVIMALAPLLVILMARKYGGDEATITNQYASEYGVTFSMLAGTTRSNATSSFATYELRGGSDSSTGFIRSVGGKGSDVERASAAG